MSSCVVTYQNPYIEQQFPLGQSPQIVLPFDAPQVPSVVTVEVAVLAGGIVAPTPPMTGSPVVEDAGGSGLPVVADPPFKQPFWHPFIRRQCPGVEPQNL